jgi:TatD DNase family protein
MIVDTHCHLFFEAFDPDRDAVIARAKEHGVKYMINVGTDPEANQQALDLSRKHEALFWTAGLHPHSSQFATEEVFEELGRFVSKEKPLAIGEIGLDYFKSEASPEIQKNVFVRMLHLALDHDLPVIVHSRNAFQDTMDILRAEGGGRLRGVMHCFSYDQKSLEALIGLGFLASFTCSITFKNAQAALEVAKGAPLDKIMLETDSPYLAPQIYRGKRNEPSCLAHLAQLLSEARGISQEALEAATTKTAIDFFKLPAVS